MIKGIQRSLAILSISLIGLARIKQVHCSNERKLAKSSKKGKSTSPKGGKFDVIVVGSGLAGLIAARELEKEGLDVQVIEAQDYIGGRMVRKVLSDEQSVDFGGQWKGITHYLLGNLTEELGITRFPAPAPTLATSVYFSGESKTMGEIYSAPGNYNQYVACRKAFTDLVEMIPEGYYPFEPEILGNETLRALDDMTVQQFVDQKIPNLISPIMKYICLNAGSGYSRVSGHYPGEPETVSLLAWAFSLKNSPSTDENPEYELFNGAAGQVPPILASQLQRPVQLNSPVVSISQKMVGGEIKATVEAIESGKKNKKIYEASNVVVATSPYISGQIQYSPALSWERHQLNQHKPMGTVAKILIEYESSLWDGSGAAFTSPEDGMLTLCIDSTDSRSSNAVYVCLITGKQYDQFASHGSLEDAKDAVLTDLANRFGEAALSPLSVDIGNWPANPHVQGSYSSYWPTQTWTRFGSALLEPHGVIQWCSTEYALKWAGYFEGAIETGLRAAKNVIEGNIGELADEGYFPPFLYDEKEGKKKKKKRSKGSRSSSDRRLREVDPA